MSGWIGVDLDGTLAEYHGWRNGGEIGRPIPAMLERVKGWLAEGKEVRIFTARVGGPDTEEKAFELSRIRQWCQEHIGVGLPVTCQKDFAMVELWDDRCMQVVINTGLPVSGVDLDPALSPIGSRALMELADKWVRGEMRHASPSPIVLCLDCPKAEEIRRQLADGTPEVPK